MIAQVVYEQDERWIEDQGTQGYQRVGVAIEGRVVWLGMRTWAPGSDVRADFEHWERIARKIAGTLAQELAQA